MSEDIFTDTALAPSHRVHYGFAGVSSSGAPDGGSTTLVPRDPEMQRLVDAMNAERDAERVRKEVEMDTPKNRQEAAEARAAEREHKKVNFQYGRTMSSHIREGWKQIMEDRKDEEIRVYTTDYKQRRFWGIKPAGVGMYDFWEQNDPEVTRYDDNIAMTWANPLVPPPITALDKNIPVIWAGQGLNPDSTLPAPPTAPSSPPNKIVAKPRKRQRAPEVNPTHRVRKSSTESAKATNNAPRVSTDKVGSRNSGLEDQLREVPVAGHANGRPARSNAAVKVSEAEQKSATEDGGSASTKRPRGRPATKTKSAANDSKRPRGRPPAKGKRAEKAPKQQKTPTVKGNARVTKSQKAKPRPSAPSTHKMRTRREGPAESLSLH